MSSLDTIIAQATPPGRGGVAIIRVSGSLVKDIALKVLGRVPPARQAMHLPFLDAENNALDIGISLLFLGPHSYTGEDILELQTHGSPAVVDLLIKNILKLGARLARPGEFSERAFLNDKLDLAQAEAVADLIDASSAQAARSALRSLQGEFSKKISALVENIIRIRMYVEAAIDFAEEEIDFLADQQIHQNLLTAMHTLLDIQASAKQGALLRDGMTVVIAGKPNVGKSSLLNKLSGKETAIVTDIPGTTRDVLREHIHIDGMPLHILDTAGIRDSKDIVEQEGIRRAHTEIQRADLLLFLVNHDEDWQAVQNELAKVTVSDKTLQIIIRNKIDLSQETPRIYAEQNQTVIALSAKSGCGIDLLKTHLKTSVGFTANSEDTFSARRRHLDALARAKTFLQNGLQQLSTMRAGELLAEDLRQAQLALNEITGEWTSDDLLGRIFSTFCIGK